MLFPLLALLGLALVLLGSKRKAPTAAAAPAAKETEDRRTVVHVHNHAPGRKAKRAAAAPPEDPEDPEEDGEEKDGKPKNGENSENSDGTPPPVAK